VKSAAAVIPQTSSRQLYAGWSATASRPLIFYLGRCCDVPRGAAIAYSPERARCLLCTIVRLWLSVCALRSRTPSGRLPTMMTTLQTSNTTPGSWAWTYTRRRLQTFCANGRVYLHRALRPQATQLTSSSHATLL